MRLHRTESMVTADRVARALRPLLAKLRGPKGYVDAVYLYPYLNGREHGWTLSLMLPGVPAFTFAQGRGGDQVVVYEDGKWNLFRGDGGQPSADAYNARSIFPSASKAARDIARRFRAHLARYGKAQREAARYARAAKLARKAGR